MIHYFRKLALAGGVLAFMTTTGTADAGLTQYFGEDLQTNPASPSATIALTNSNAANSSFMSHLSGVTTENFNSFTDGTTTPITAKFGADTATLAGEGGIITNQNDKFFNGKISNSNNAIKELDDGRFGINQSQYFKSLSNFSLTFDHPQAAFGFYGIDIGDIGGQLKLTFDSGSTQTITLSKAAIGPSANGSVLFFGVIGSSAADLFTKIDFTNTSGMSDAFAFDNLTIGRLEQVVATPEPETLISAGVAGLLGLGYDLRRRRSNRTA